MTIISLAPPVCLDRTFHDPLGTQNHYNLLCKSKLRSPDSDREDSSEGSEDKI